MSHSIPIRFDDQALQRRVSSTRSVSREGPEMSSESSSKVIGSRIERFLRGRHPMKTADHVAVTTGCSRAQVAKWLEGGTAPSAEAIARLTLAYGPAFLAAFLGDLAPAWLNDDVREQRMNELDARRRALEEEMQSLNRG